MKEKRIKNNLYKKVVTVAAIQAKLKAMAKLAPKHVGETKLEEMVQENLL